ncbi:hypothetical protein Peur_057759 [Populus x canadensis]
MKINQARMLHTVFHYACFIWISSIYSRLVLSPQILHPPPKCLNFDEKEQVANMIAENSLKVFPFHSSCHLFRLHMRMSGVLHLTMIWGSHLFMVITVHDEDHPGDWSRCY